MAGATLRIAGEIMLIRHSQFGVEAIVIGGGPSGSAVASLLARQGRSVEMIEQSPTAEHKVCGEFISHEASQYLCQLGIDLEGLGALPIHGVRLSARRRIAACSLPFPALSITRRSLDEQLILQAAKNGVRVLRGHRVETLQSSRGAWSAVLSDGTIRSAPAAFLATGKHDLRGYRRPSGTQNEFVAFKMYFRLSPIQQKLLYGWVELFLFPGGYAGLQLTEGLEANLCLLIHRRALHRCRNDWATMIEWMTRFSEPLAERLDGAKPLLERPLAISLKPYGLLQPSSDSGLWFLGDQAAVIPSFCGDGISIALHSAKVASELYERGGTPDLLAYQLHRQLRRQIALAGLLAKLMSIAPELANLARLWPGLLRQLAMQTRIPEVELRL